MNWNQPRAAPRRSTCIHSVKTNNVELQKSHKKKCDVTPFASPFATRFAPRLLLIEIDESDAALWSVMDDDR